MCNGTENGDVNKNLSSGDPFISVMILNYSYGELLPRALEACAAQTFRDFELVMINNGAIDNTEEIYQDFCAKHPEVKTTYVHIEQNQGPTHGWNEGLKQARGEYVLFNDADDWMEPDCLECLTKRAKETGADRVTGQFRDALPEGGTGRIHNCFGDVSLHSGWLQAVIFRRSILTKYKLEFPEGEGAAYFDMHFTYAFVSKEEKRGESVPRVLYNYNVRTASLSAKYYERVAKGFYATVTRPVIDMASRIIHSDIDDALRNEIMYVTTKSAFIRIMTLEKYLSASEWKQVQNDSQKRLDEKLPGWDKNPLLWPFGNGYNLTESIGTYALVQVSKLHATWLLRLMCRVSDLFKIRR